MILGRAPLVPELEPLEAEDAGARPLGGPVRGSRTDPAEADNRDLELGPLRLSHTSVSVCEWYS